VSPAATETLPAGRGATLLSRGIEPAAFGADITAMRLLVFAAVALFGGGHGTQTITGTISVNTGSSLTVIAANHSLTCAVTSDKGQAAILKWGTGVRVAMACSYEKGHFVVSRLTRLGSTEPQRPTTTTTSTETHPTTTTTSTETHPTTTTTTSTETHPTTQQQRREAIGVIIALASGGVGIKPDNGGEAFTCRITTALDSQQAAAKLTLGAHAGIVCRLDGTSWVLAGATLVS
jgi:hypothetical protein